MFQYESASGSRRAMLRRSSVGFGSLALASLLGNESQATESANPLAPVQPHFPARAKRIIFLFMSGGPSQVDTFDPKPLLTRDDGKPLPFDKPRVQFNATANMMKSPWRFRQYGESGLWVKGAPSALPGRLAGPSMRTLPQRRSTAARSGVL